MRIKMKYIAIAALIVSIIALWWAIESTRASIDYWMEKPQTLTKGLNSITVYCKNGGETDGDFYLVLTFMNASFSNQTTQPYVQVDNSTVKCRFLLHKGDENEKTIYFSVNETTDRFSLQLSLEKLNWYDFLRPNSIYPTELEYRWNEETKSFCCID